MYPPYVSSYLFLGLAVWSWLVHKAITVCVCNAAIWCTSIMNHHHRSQHIGWWYADIAAVHFSLWFHFVQGVFYLPLVPHILLESLIVLASGGVFLIKSRKDLSGWYQLLVHLLMSCGVVLHTLLVFS